MNEEKNRLRNHILREIEELPLDYITNSDMKIFESVVSLPEFQRAKRVFLFHSMGREPDTLQLINHAISLEKIIALPLCLKDREMDARIINRMSDVSFGKFGIMAPAENAPLLAPNQINFILVPAVTYDRCGYRLGRGGGYYDRFLSKTRAFTVGVARDRLLYDVLPREAHDRRVDCIVTEKAIARLR